MCGRYVIKNPVTKTNKLVKSAIQVEDIENYNAHPYQKLPVIKKSNHLNRLITLSPLTEMASKFHSRNGAKLIQVNETTQNFEYEVIKDT